MEIKVENGSGWYHVSETREKEDRRLIKAEKSNQSGESISFVPAQRNIETNTVMKVIVHLMVRGEPFSFLLMKF